MQNTLSDLCSPRREGGYQTRDYSILIKGGLQSSTVKETALQRFDSRPAATQTAPSSSAKRLRLLPRVETISNTSLQDVGDQEVTGLELARYMGELNRRWRQRPSRMTLTVWAKHHKHQVRQAEDPCCSTSSNTFVVYAYNSWRHDAIVPQSRKRLRRWITPRSHWWMVSCWGYIAKSVHTSVKESESEGHCYVVHCYVIPD